MDRLPSLGGLSSLAIIQVLMNWHVVARYFPDLERLVSQLNVEDTIHRFLKTWTGCFLVGIAVGGIILHLLYTLWNLLTSFVLGNWRVKCAVNECHVSYDHILDWLSKHPASQSLPEFKAAAVDGNRGNPSMEGVDFGDGEDSLDLKRRDKSPSYRPYVELVHFWRDGAYFWFKMRPDQKVNRWGDHIPDLFLDVYCFTWNRSCQPVKDLLNEIQSKYAISASPTTTIHGPSLASQNSYATQWQVMRRRKKRALNTVIMDRVQRDIVVNDVRTFLSSQGVRWYNEKGFPIRLGYLFYGPPGTGKSSFAFSLAGHFGLPVYMLNLSLPLLTDSMLEELFLALPFHCIIMLEDIDATKPLNRDKEPDPDTSTDLQQSSEVGSGSSENQDKTSSSSKKKEEEAVRIKRNTVTLSGLLNAIDGVGASEGRILILSTNKIEALDEALIRPGRADRIVEFANTTKEQAGDMFVAAYTGTRWVHQPTRGSPAAPRPRSEDWTDEDIEALAKDFSDKIHDEKFSPAILQQYFKDFRAEPRLAVRELDEWMKDPRGYRKPVVFEQPEKACPRDSGGGGKPTLWSSMSSSTSATEDLMSLDDLGGYKEPECFDPDVETKVVPLLDVSSG